MLLALDVVVQSSSDSECQMNSSPFRATFEKKVPQMIGAGQFVRWFGGRGICRWVKLTRPNLAWSCPHCSAKSILEALVLKEKMEFFRVILHAK